MSVTRDPGPVDASLAEYSAPQLQQLLDEQAADIGRALAARGLMIRTAESCTGGAIARALTEVAGSSAWFDCAYVTYSNAAKMRLLQVPEDMLQTHGAVSEPVARAMASGALRDTDGEDACVSLAVTGVAGPDGGTVDKPVGTVWFGWAGPDRGGQCVRSCRVIFAGDRSAVRLQTAIYALRQIQTFWL